MLLQTSDAFHQSGAELPAQRGCGGAETRVRALLQGSSQTFMREFAVKTSQIQFSTNILLLDAHLVP